MFYFSCFLTLLSVVAYWGYAYRIQTTAPFSVNCLEGWAHRGYVNEAAGFFENTIVSYQQAIDLGASGIEIDVLYDVDIDNFIVSHNEPYTLQQDGSVLLLQDALSALPMINIWLDAKNISSLWPWQAVKATARLRSILATAKQQHKVLVESRSPWYLRDLANHNIHTTLMISPNPERNAVAMWGSIMISKLFFAMGNFNGVSMGYQAYAGQVRTSFSNAPSYLSTLNDVSIMQTYLQLPQVRVFLTDNPKLYGQHCRK